MASPNLSELVTTTLRRRSGSLADNVSNSNALLSRLNRRGNVRTVSGGRTIVQELDYAENATFQYYSGYETLNVSPSDVISAAEFVWKQAAVNVTISGLEQRQNSGREAIISLVNARLTNAERTMANNLSTGIYSDGTGTGGKQIGGLQLLVAEDPSTGTVGGINRANFTFWRNQYYDMTSGLATSSAGNIQRGMRNLWISCTRGSDQPDLITADSNYFEFFWGSLTSIQRITSDEGARAGFTSLAFRTADVIYDGDSGHLASSMFFLNTDYLFWRPHSDANVTPMPDKMSINQDAIVMPLIFMGNLTMSNASLQGVLSE